MAVVLVRIVRLVAMIFGRVLVLTVLGVGVVFVSMSFEAVGMMFDHAGVLLPIDNDFQAGANLTQQRMAEIGVDDAEFRGIAAHVAAFLVDRGEPVVDELAIFENLEQKFRIFNGHGLLLGRVEKVDRYGMGRLIVQQLGEAFSVAQFDQVAAVRPFGRVIVGMGIFLDSRGRWIGSLATAE